MDKPIRNDKFYSQACEEAKDDYFLLHIRRTDAEVDDRAGRLREEAKREQANRN